MASLYLPAPTRSGTNRSIGGGRINNSSAGGGGGTTAIVNANAAPRGGGGPIPAGSGKDKKVPSYEERCNAALRFSRLSPEARKSSKNRGGMFVPRSAADFDDGGSFPEIHVAQYPRHMGNPHMEKKRGGATGGGSGGVSGGPASAPGGRAIVTKDVLSATVDANGKVRYDALVTGGTNSDKKVYSRHSDLRGCKPTAEDVALPTQEEEQSTAERTQRALAALVSTKVAMDKPAGSAMAAAADSATAQERTQFIRYTPHESAPGYNPNAAERIVRMVPAQIDPMRPPKHMHRKAPRGPAEDPVPVLHAPSEKLSKEEREAWNIPACISNWKNTRGYTIPLDKRLAADGRGLREEATINPNFAVISESLYVAERQAREEVRTRSAVQKRLVLDRRQKREDELRDLANRARMERSSSGQPTVQRQEETIGTSVEQRANAGAPSVPKDDGGRGGGGGDGRASGEYRIDRDGHRGDGDDDSVESATRRKRRSDSNDDGADGRGRDGDRVPEEGDGANEEELGRIQRDRLRAERRREREREYRLERAGKASVADEKADEELHKKRRLENDRDVSEKIALGTHVGSGGAAGAVDSRLYGQNAGMDSGFGADDEYNAYSRPMFDRDGVTSSSIYRPTRNEGGFGGDADEEVDKLKKGATSKFIADKGFGGAGGNDGDDSGAVAGGAARTAPVQFEKGR